MSDNESGQDQPGLWDPPGAHLSEHPGPRRHASRSRKQHSGRQTDEQPATPASRDRFDVEDLWDVDRVAAYLGVPKQTLYAWRHSGKGPKGFRVGKHLRWRAQTVVEWTLELERDQ